MFVVGGGRGGHDAVAVGALQHPAAQHRPQPEARGARRHEVLLLLQRRAGLPPDARQQRAERGADGEAERRLRRIAEVRDESVLGDAVEAPGEGEPSPCASG